MMTLDSNALATTNAIAEYIEHIKGGVVTAPALGQAFRLHPSRVRAYINLARCMGLPICSNSKGYYYSTDPAEIQATIDHIQDRIDKQTQAVKGLMESIGGKPA